MKINKKSIFFSVILFILVIVSLELFLSLFAFDRGVVLNPDRYLVDKRLGKRPNPMFPGHDRRGFRNPNVPAEAYMVALGDSQTYGAGVVAEDAWPRQLESMIGEVVYGMAFGGYGPVHSLILWDEAVTLRPKIIVEAFYAGNDLFDSFDVVYNKKEFLQLKSQDHDLQLSVQKAEQSEPITKRVKGMYRMGATDGDEPSVAQKRSSAQQLLERHSKLYRFFHQIRFPKMRSGQRETPKEEWEIAEAFAKEHPSYCQIFKNDRVKTVFTSEYRLSALDLADPRIAEGLQVSLRALRMMKELASARKIHFLVVLIPTKETVFKSLWQNPTENYRRLTENEERFWGITKDFLQQNEIQYLDSLPVLQEQLHAGPQPYYVSQDGHPNEHGHAAIAKLVATYLKSASNDLRQGGGE